MSSILKRISILIVGVTLCVTSLTAEISEPIPPKSEPPDQSTLPEVVVTATRTKTPIDKTASSVSVVTSEEIERKQYRTLRDALNGLPGVTTAASGSEGSTTGLFIRGTESRHTRIMVDGQFIPQALGGSILNDLSLENVERVEVVRGPSSAIYGSSAQGGVVNIITKSGKGIGKPVSKIGFEAGSFHSFREVASSRGAIGPFDYSVEYARKEIENSRTNDEARFNNGNVKLGYQLKEDLYFSVRSFYSLNDTGSPGSITSPDTDENLLREIWQVAPKLEWQTSDLWHQSLTYNKQQRRQVVVNQNYNNNNRIQVNTDQIDYQSNFQLLDNLLLSGGYSLEQREVYRYRNYTTATSAAKIDYTNDQTNQGLFLQSQWEPLADWVINASGRVDHYSDYGNPLTYKIGSSYLLPVTNTLIHANYGNSFTPVEEQNYLGTINRKFSPEQGWGYEVGISQKLLKDQLTVFGTYFHNDIQNYIQYDPISSEIANTDARTKGYETGLVWKPISQIEIQSNYTYLDTLNKRTQTFLTRRPRHSVNSQLSYIPIESVRLGLGSSWALNRFEGFKTEDYFVTRFTADWRINEQWKLFGRVENLLNEQYAEVEGYPAQDRAFYGGFDFTF